MNAIKVIGSILFLIFFLGLASTGYAQEDEATEAESLPQVPGRVVGTGTHFEVTDSAYLNITLDSSEPLELVLESVPKVIGIYLMPMTDASTAEITLRGLASNGTYYKYEDDNPSYVTFVTDAAGNYSFTQDISTWHLIDIQTMPSTRYIYDGDPNGHCASIGNWDNVTKTCTLDGDVDQHIRLLSDDITLDGAGYTVDPDPPGNYSSSVIIGQVDGVTLKNLKVTGCYRGILLGATTNAVLSGNTVWNTRYGIVLVRAHSNSFENNTLYDNVNAFLGEAYGPSTYNSFVGNTMTNNQHHGIQLYQNSDYNTVDGNTVMGGGLQNYGLYFVGSHNTIVNNTISGMDTVGLQLSNWAWNNTVYNNNFSNNNRHIMAYRDTVGNILNLAAPIGGNWYDTFDEPAEGCYNIDGESFCDGPLLFKYDVQDNLPWTEHSGWANSPPIADAGGPYLVALGESITLDGTLSTDPDGDQLIYAWVPDGNLDDGSLAMPVYTGNAVGIETLTLTVTDPSGASDSAEAMVVTYDTDGGFVTGGGWINSEIGWCQLDEVCAGVDGKANFGFVSKYKKGASVPTGNTEFNFKDGGLNFHSSSYDWLIVNQNGINAQYKGSGSVNGEGEYKFMLWAKDLDPDEDDTFRIKIWYENGGELVVYDNGSDQAIGGGNIVVHTK